MKRTVFAAAMLAASLLSSGANAAYVASLTFVQPTGTVGPNDVIPVKVKLNLDETSDPLSTDANGQITSPFQFLLDAQEILAGQVTNTYVNTYFLCSGTFTNVCSPGAYSFDFAFNAPLASEPTSLVFPSNLNILPGTSFEYDFGTFTPNGGPAAPGTYKFFGSGATLNFNYTTTSPSGEPINNLYSYTLAQTCPDGEPCSFSRTVTGAVPEPATWLMMIFGFGLVGGAMRYRQRQPAKVSFG
jgi:hypothetical protein